MKNKEEAELPSLAVSEDVTPWPIDMPLPAVEFSFDDPDENSAGLSSLADKTVICPICGAETKLFLYASTIDWCWQSQCLDCGETFKYNPQTGEATDDFPDLRN